MYGLPLPAIGDQPCIPSDHLHVSARYDVGWTDRVGEGGGGEGIVRDL